METKNIIEFIDSWLADSPHVLDNRTTDFALDLRTMVEALSTELEVEPALVTAA